jgi:dolichol-phosphate mannosyltransferase
VRAVIVLPTYNERDNVEPFLRAVRAVCDIDVLVVDDNSPDGTGDLVRELGSELGGIEVLQRETKAGLGSAYRAGFDKVLGASGDACYDVVVSMDADLSHDPAALPAMLALIGDGADLTRRVLSDEELRELERDVASTPLAHGGPQADGAPT